MESADINIFGAPFLGAGEVSIMITPISLPVLLDHGIPIKWGRYIDFSVSREKPKAVTTVYKDRLYFAGR